MLYLLILISLPFAFVIHGSRLHSRQNNFYEEDKHSSRSSHATLLANPVKHRPSGDCPHSLKALSYLLQEFNPISRCHVLGGRHARLIALMSLSGSTPLSQSGALRKPKIAIDDDITSDGTLGGHQEQKPTLIPQSADEPAAPVDGMSPLAMRPPDHPSPRRQPPAWVALQIVPPDWKRTVSAPPCLETLTKQGRGKSARWLLASYHADELQHHFDVGLALEAHPEEPRCRLEFWNLHGRNASARGFQNRVGTLSLAGEDCISVLKGMRIREEWRGRGLSKVFLAVWLHLCRAASVAPRTHVMNKPIIAFQLTRFGFRPRNAGAYWVQVTDAVRTEDWVRASSSKPSTQIGTTFLPPEDHVLDHHIEVALENGSLSLAADSLEIKQALTLRSVSSILGP